MNGLLNHSYFQKSVKTPLVIMEKSAMSHNQRYSILSNEMIRRLSNTNHEAPDIEDVTNIIETFTQQLNTFLQKCSIHPQDQMQENVAGESNLV